MTTSKNATKGSDDLSRIEGVGPQVAAVLKSSGITTFAQLAASTADQLRTILKSAGVKYNLSDPKTWPEQADLAAAGKWQDLDSLQKKLKGGRRSGTAATASAVAAPEAPTARIAGAGTATYTRKNAWNNGGTFENPDLLWYARGVGVMQSLSLDNPNSWWFFAAIHGEYITTGNTNFPGWGFIPGPPQVPTTPLPSQQLQDLYWDQCQHQSWFFAPWHRGYLFALEAQIRAAVAKLGGPSDWALPYWNYFGPDNEFKIPPAFTEQNLPDGTPNPLFVKARYGPEIQREGDIFVIVGPNDANADCQNNTVYTGFNTITNPPGYGGPPTGFWHNAGTNGNLEQNPHNLVHVDVGGNKQLLLFSVGLEFVDDLNKGNLPVRLLDAFSEHNFWISSQDSVTIIQKGISWQFNDGELIFSVVKNESKNVLDIYAVTGGLMADPGTAALDPIFYLHHCNIDRMWAAWNEKNSNLIDEFWTNGSVAIGQRGFAMPLPDESPWYYTPNDVNSITQLEYAYDDLNGTISPQPSNKLAQRLMKLGVVSAEASVSQGANMGGRHTVELLGTHDGTLQITGLGTRATVRLDSGVRKRVFASLANASATSLPDHVYLHLENVRGTKGTSKLNVFVNQQHVGTVALFGLERASSIDGLHGGMGLNFIFDITDIMDNLHLDNTTDVDSLDVRIEPNNAFAGIATIGRVSVYRGGQR